MQSTGQAELGHLPHRFEDDAARHLRPAGAALCEDDRNLDDLDAAAEGAVGRLDLEGVALGPNPIERRCLEGFATPALETARKVVDRDAEDRPSVEGAKAADCLPSLAPVLRDAAVDIARAEREPGALGCAEKARNVGGVVREV